LPEVVGDAGFQVNPYDIEDIAAAIERVIDDSELRRTLAVRAARHSRQFNWECTATQTWNVLSESMAC
ncbi:MAG: glycosyltransferase family 1 protein, partial [Deltaproteobacteria bacterium]|nr:glycosyltransferase family 1 protein [Deltaproteobacteria bacterium]